MGLVQLFCVMIICKKFGLKFELNFRNWDLTASGRERNKSSMFYVTLLEEKRFFKGS